MIADGWQWLAMEAQEVSTPAGAGVTMEGTHGGVCRESEIGYVVGGAKPAGQAAMNFAKYAERSVILVRGESLAQHHVANI